MSSQPKHCYLDEFGSFGFDFAKSDGSTHFIVGGAVVAENKVERLSAQLEEVARDHFSGSAIKSKNVAGDDKRRLKILDELLLLDFHIYCFVVDKREIAEGPLRKYKPSFIKYLNSLAYDELYLSFPRLSLFADVIGSKDFMKGFVKYVEKKYLRQDLFGNSDFGFRGSRPNRLTQLADFVVGTIARCYDVSKLSPRADEIMSALVRSGKLLPIAEWPKRAKHYFQQQAIPGFGVPGGDVDEMIEQQSIRTAQRFFDEAKGSDDEFIREQVASLKYMMFTAMYKNPSRYVGTDEFIKNLKLYPDTMAEKKPFGRCVIGKLRDSGVLISSNGRGYKLVVNQCDLEQFVKYYEHFIGPMLKRLGKCRDKVRLATQNELDILNSERYQYLKAFFEPRTQLNS